MGAGFQNGHKKNGASCAIPLNDNAILQALFGPGDSHARLIEEKLGVELQHTARGIEIRGKNTDKAVSVIRELILRHNAGETPGIPEINALLSGSGAAIKYDQGSRNGKLVRARNLSQEFALHAMNKNNLTFLVGPAGTGKTFLASAMAAALLQDGTVKRIILTRPAVEAGEKLGFLPGDLRDKVDPYLRPLYDCMGQAMEVERFGKLLDAGIVEIAPLAYMRGRTLSESCVILDEAQNTTPQQMKMFLTRLGNDSKMFVTGDTTQSDLPPGMPNGLSDAVEKLQGIKGVAVAAFSDRDVVRHPLVSQIINAYENQAGLPQPG